MKKILSAVIAGIILTATAAFAAPPQFDTPYIGNINTMKFHHRDCRSVNQMWVEHQRPLSSREEAIEQGYIPCMRCKP